MAKDENIVGEREKNAVKHLFQMRSVLSKNLII